MEAAIARGDIEAAVGAEDETPAVVPAPLPREQFHFAFRVAPRRILPRGGQPHHPRAVGQRRRAVPILVTGGIAEVDEPVGRIVGIGDDAVHGADGEFFAFFLAQPGHELADIDDQVGLSAFPIVRKREDVALHFRHEPAVAGG